MNFWGNEAQKILGYDKLEGFRDYSYYSGPTVDMPQPVKIASTTPWVKWVKGAGFGLGLFVLLQVVLAFASHDLRGHRARSIDNATIFGGLAGIATAVFVGGRDE